MADPADYALLGLAPGAPAEEIKRAWRRVARATHPDLHPGDAEAERRFRAAQAAYERLSDPSRGPSPRAAGPDEDWIDACAWVAEAHLLRLRSDILPRYAARHRGGPSLAAALAAAPGGLAEAAPDERPTRWARLWAWHTWRRVELLVDDRGLGGPLTLLYRDGRARIVVRPHAFWAEGIRDEDALRRSVRRGIDLAIVAAAPVVLGVAAPTQPDRAWWGQRLFWPVAWGLFVVFSFALLAASWRAANAPERPIPERIEWATGR